METDLDIKRIQALTDGAFAIVMTITILEVKIPDGLNSIELSTYFIKNTLQELFIYIMGFATLGILWIGSHYHHHHIMKTDRISSWININFLMFICIIPFSISFLYNYRHDKLSVIFLSINLILCSATNYFMLWYAWKKEYIKPHFTKVHLNNAKHRILIPVYIYLSIILISFYFTTIALYLFLIPALLHLIPEKGNQPLEKS